MISKPAFPWNGQGIFVPEKGMTMRQYYAAAALTGLLSDGNIVDLFRGLERVSFYEAVATQAHKCADAMIAFEEGEGVPV